MGSDLIFTFYIIAFISAYIRASIDRKTGEIRLARYLEVVDDAGIIEDENSTGGEFSNLQTNGVNMRSHMGVPNSLHHKYAIADANVSASDPILLTGSHNWSSNAENNSDENTLIIHDATIANIYLQEFKLVIMRL